MSKLRYTEEHEWLRADDAGLFTVGITSHAQHALGDIVYVQLPELRHYAAGEEIAVLESVKAASNIIAAVPGEVVAVNDALESDPGLVNTSPMDEGWFFRFQPNDAADIQGLLTGDAYDRLLTALADH